MENLNETINEVKLEELLDHLDQALLDDDSLKDKVSAIANPKAFSDLKKRFGKDKDLIKFLENNNRLSDDKKVRKKEIALEVDRFIGTEVLLSVVHSLELDLPLREANLAFILKNEPLISLEHCKNVELAKKLRCLVSLRHKPTGNPGVWYDRVTDYMAFPKCLRLFKEENVCSKEDAVEGSNDFKENLKSVEETNKLEEANTLEENSEPGEENQVKHSNTLTILASNLDNCDRELDREGVYFDFLETMIIKPNRELQHIDQTKGDFLYSRQIKSTTDGVLDYQTKSVTPLYPAALDLIEEGDLLSAYELPNYQPKAPLTIPKDFPVKEMLKWVSGPDETLPMISFKFANPYTNELTLTGVIHILGALGVGKSNFKYGMTKYFLDVQGANRIAIIEDKVSNVLKVVKKLRSMGIKAIPLVGKDDQKHLSDFLNTLTVEQYEKEEMTDWLSGECLILSSQADFDSEAKYAPCRGLTQSEDCRGSRVCCPYISACGRMKRYRDLNDSPVWVTTVHSVLSASVPNAFNRNDRTFFELLYDATDLIFFDEVDGTQEILDGGFLHSQLLLHGYELSADLSKLRTRVESANRLLEVPRLSVALAGFENARAHFNELLYRCASARKSVLETVLTLKSLYFQIINAVDLEATTEKDANHLQMALKSLLSVVNIHFYSNNRDKTFQEALDRSELYQAYSEVVHEYEMRNHNGRYGAYTPLFNEIKQFFEKLNIKFKKKYRKSADVVYELTAFLITMIDLDRFYKMIITECDHIRLSNPSLISDLYTLKMDGLSISDFTHEPLLDMRYGYLIKEIPEKDTYRLDLYQYTGVGRKLLKSLSDIKAPLGQPGPAVIGLSGTSFFEDSLKYNFNFKPDLLLESINEDGSIRKEGKIKMYYIPAIDRMDKGFQGSTTKAPYAAVSGGGATLQDRAEHYYQILNHLEGKNHLKMDYFEMATKEKPALIVTGNYAEAECVHEWLCSRGYESVGLVQEKKNKDFVITRSEVEDLAYSKYKDRQFLVVSLESIARGFNILNHYNSHYGAVFFLTRPYPQPLSFETSLKKTHALYDEVVKELLDNEELSLSERLKQLYVSNTSNFDAAYNMGYWSDLTLEEKIWLSADALVPIKQMVGRTQRNQNDTMVFFCDGAFSRRENKEFIGTPEGDSMFDCWLISLARITKTHEFGESLFGEFYRALLDMVDSYRKQQEC